MSDHYDTVRQQGANRVNRPSRRDGVIAVAIAIASAIALISPSETMTAGHAAEFPTRNITLVVPYPAGGGVDAMARVVAQKLSDAFRQTVTVDNRGGGGGTIGTRAVARAAPDGYTLLLGHTGTLSINPSLYTKLGRGAIPNTTPLPNVSLGLSQGTFDGLITSNETISSGQFWESGIRHGFEDHQFVAEYIPLLSRVFWQKLSPEFQQIFTDQWRDNISTYRDSMAAAQARARENLQAHGVKIVVPSAEEIAATRQEMMAKQEQAAKLSKIAPEMLAALSAVLAAG